MRNFCLQTYRNNRIHQKAAFFFEKIHTSPEKNSRVLRIKNPKFSWYYFYTNLQRDFQFSVSGFFKIFSRIWCSAFFNLAALYLWPKSFVTGFMRWFIFLKYWDLLCYKYILLKDIFHGIYFCNFDYNSPIFPKQKRSQLD